MATYYIDWTDGDDDNDGTAPQKAWKSIGNALTSGKMTTSVANTIWVKPVHMPSKIVSSTSATARQTFKADMYGEVKWRGTRQTLSYRWPQRAVVSSYLSGFNNPATAGWTVDLNCQYLTFIGFEFRAGAVSSGNGCVKLSSTCIGFEAYDCVFVEDTRYTSSVNVQGTAPTTSSYDLVFDRCAFYGGAPALECISPLHNSTELDLNCVMRNCLFVGGQGNTADTSVRITTSGTGTVANNGWDITNCTFWNTGRAIWTAGSSLGGTYPTNVTHCLFINCVGGWSLYSSSFSPVTMVSDYNVFTHASPYTIVVGGANDLVGRATLLQEFENPRSFRSNPLAPRIGSYLIGNPSSADFAYDMLYQPRPNSGSTSGTTGAFECDHISQWDSSSLGTNTGRKQLMYGPGSIPMTAPVDPVETQISVQVRIASASYGGTTYPQLLVTDGEEVGVTDQTATATSSCSDAWETISVTFTPTKTGVVKVSLVSRGTSETGQCYFDKFSVT